MTIYTDWNEQECKKVARLSGVKQTEADVRYARKIAYFSPRQLYVLRSNSFFLLAVRQTYTMRIIGIAVVKSEQRQGWGSRLLAKAIADSIRGGYCSNYHLDKVRSGLLRKAWV